MMILIIGGSGSGKSEYAEERAVAVNEGELIYIATMQPFDLEGEQRIIKHREMRKDKNFKTVECYTHLEKTAIKKGQTVLLECMSNLVANEMFSESGRTKNTAEIILCGINQLKKSADSLIIVTNNVFDDGILYDSETQKYLKTISEINKELAMQADQVIEVVHKIPIVIKSGGHQ